ncbi:DUF808 domain-containing protein [Algoriphagus sediminis]|uniref:DUF808 domain-containing protein n=1 Tax=Algoriphagus sediminis TaxID=3057113 RepID=A0ABT7Y8L6_9BACT|nr:DUF808 domain-containing protein [Algoriphagus sediminis]MDN3202811.1 DUF808 domain-containing protein [Algoriphagus sediminis]
MASGLIALLDDVATLMDDVSVMSKVAAKKTAGLLGDDLAVNAEKASGFVADRELPVLWAITKGSLLNKLIILPLAFVLSAFVPSVITMLLILGGFYLAYEGAEKIYEYFFPHTPLKQKDHLIELSEEQLKKLEKKKIKSAILTDFILSVEIIIIALGTVTESDLTTQIIVVSVIALVATVGVYGLVALIVRMDEFGLSLVNLNEQDDSFSDKVGRFLINALPMVIKGLTIVGTIALLLVSGGIFSHNIDFFHHLLESWPAILRDMLIGLVMGFITLFVISGVKKLFGKKKAA